MMTADPGFSKNARWLTATDGNESWQIFRKEFTMKSTIVSALLLVTSSSYHEAYCNGILVNRGPARSFGFDKYYNAIDVTRWVKSGRNALAILAPQHKQNDAPFMLNPPDSGVLCELIIAFTDSKEMCISSDCSWKTHRHEALVKDTAWYAIPLGPEEHYDARLEMLPGRVCV